jgi:hypothetical protein
MDGFEGDEYDPASLHKYLYVSANPGNFVDPTGHEGEGGLAGALTGLAASVTIFAIEQPVLLAIVGAVGSALLPEEVNNVILMSGIPGVEALGEAGQAEAAGIKLIKNSASEVFAARALGQMRGQQDS